ncbi:MAG: hypothetical protein HC824_20780 [Synechococcales cyanobacterium RM1_1_8]|nr:hypothetical protein [Synechococcales cyanobacterium RM1_1_8]
MPSSFYANSSPRVAPCIVDRGIVYQKQDMHCLLADLTRVRYQQFQDGELISQGEGYVKRVFADCQSSTLVANHSLYLNVESFDYLELNSVGPETHPETHLDLVQDSRRLRLVPLSNPLDHHSVQAIDSATLEVMMAEVLSANLDAQLDDDHNGLF